MEPQNSPGIFPSSYHPSDTPPNVTPPNPTNQPPKNKSGKTGDMIIGILIGIFQVPIIWSIFAFVSPYMPAGFSNNFPLYALFIFFVIIVVETSLLNKKGISNMARGILIGTILIPVLAFGACLLMLR